MRRFRFRQSATNRCQSITIYLSIGIDNRYQSITTRIFPIVWSLIININRLIDIDYIDWIPRENKIPTQTKGSMYIKWEELILNQQVSHVNLWWVRNTLSISIL